MIGTGVPLCLSEIPPAITAPHAASWWRDFLHFAHWRHSRPTLLAADLAELGNPDFRRFEQIGESLE